MNAAARLVHQPSLVRHFVFSCRLSRQDVITFLMAGVLMFSALGTIYVTHVSRLIYANYQHSLVERDQLHVQHDQLLLERSTMMMQSRIQQVAENKLNMIIPNQKTVVIVHE
jgi:cell division protein FtsL